jgi:putative ATPase
MKDLGYGEGYQHAHQHADALTAMECLPESLAGTQFYQPTSHGVEARLRERIEEIRKWKAEPRGQGR